MTARFLQHLRIFVDLASDDRTKRRHEVAAETSAADDDTEALSQHPDRSMPGHVLGRHNNQLPLLFAQCPSRADAITHPASRDADQRSVISLTGALPARKIAGAQKRVVV
jgi:hypothetical protein